MALILPQNLPPPADPAAARLEATLASLPDDWTLLPGRQIGGADGPEVGFVLVHPAIGIALVDLLPARPADGVARLRDLIAADHAIGDDDVLPVVAVALTPDEIPDVGERLAEAFDTASECDTADQAWPRRVIDLLLDAQDAAMSPLPPRLDRAVHRQPLEVYEAPFAADEPALLSAPARRHFTFATICAAIVAVIGVGGAAAYLLTEQPADTPMATAMSVPLPEPTPRVVPAPPPAPKVAQTPAPQIAQTPAPAATAPAPIVVEPRPAPQAPPPPGASGLVAASPAPPPPTVADSTPPQATIPSPPEPAPVAAPPPAPAQDAAALLPPPASAKPQPVKIAPAKAPKAPPKSGRKDVATAANQAPIHAKPAAKRMASLEPRAKTDGEMRSYAALQEPAASPNTMPPLDASDLPPLEGSTAPSSTADLPLGTPVPLPVPFSRGTPAPGMPVMLLPQVGPPAAMPVAPSVGSDTGGLVGPPGGR